MDRGNGFGQGTFQQNVALAGTTNGAGQQLFSEQDLAQAHAILHAQQQAIRNHGSMNTGLTG